MALDDSFLISLTFLLFGLIIVLEFPPLFQVFCITGLHQQLVLLLTDGKTLVGADMLDGVVMVMVRPVLVTLATVTSVEDDITPSIVKTCLISPDLPLLAHHPVLVAPLAMTRPQTYSLVMVLRLGSTVNTLPRPSGVH